VRPLPIPIGHTQMNKDRNMKLKWLVLLLLSLTTLSVRVFADDSEGFLFQGSYAPSKTYVTTVSTKSSNSFKLEGKSEDMKDKLKQTQFPIQIEGNQTTRMMLTTDKVDEQGNIPFVIKVVENTSSYTMGGKKVPSGPRLEDAALTGLIDGKTKRINILSIKGKDLPPQVEGILTKIFEDAQNQLEFPAYPMKPGDSFTQRLKLQIPVPGLQPLDFFTIVKYTLKEIEASFAVFDIKIDLELATKNSELQMSVEGGGLGTMRFDMKNGLPLYYVSSMDLRFTIDAPDMRFTMKSTFDTKREYAVE